MSQSKQALNKQDVNARPASLGFLVLLVLLGIISTVLYGWLYSLSWEFTYYSIFKERPLIPVLSLFAAVFLIYLVAIALSRRAAQNGLLIGVIVGFAVLFRIVMVFSYPIQEVDIYRYMWDGEVQTQGVSPFEFSPYKVWAADTDTNLDGFIDNAEAVAAGFTDSNRDGVWDQLGGAPPMATKNPDLKKLAAHRDSDPSVEEILHRVHYGELPTIYPPTSQLVFRVSAMISPSGAWALETDDPDLQKEQIEQAVNHRLWVMKGILVAFDLGVLILLIRLLALSRMPVGLSLAYGWCPLVMKEVANGGHLDAIAVFLSVLAIYLLVRLVAQPINNADQDNGKLGSLPLAILTALVLAAAVGAKLYPIVLAPLVFIGILRRCSWQVTGVASIIFVAAAFLLVRPMLPSAEPTETDVKLAAAAQDVTEAAEQLAAAERLPVAEQLAAAEQLPAVKKLVSGEAPLQNFEDDPSAGLTKFLKTWEMNDFIFMIAVENLKDEVDPNKLPIWFSIVPEGARQSIVKPFTDDRKVRLEELEKKYQETQNRLVTTRQEIAGLTENESTELRMAQIKDGIYFIELQNIWRQMGDIKGDISGTPFKITRGLTSFVFLLIALWFAWRAGVKAQASDGLANGSFYCEAAFLTLAWFWLLLPTQNPWYWLWALPFLPFMRNRAWFAVSGIVLFYYFRFWMEYHFTEIDVWETPYQGVAFFDFVLTWFEFAPWFIWLAVEGIIWLFIDSAKKRRNSKEPMVATTSS